MRERERERFFIFLFGIVIEYAPKKKNIIGNF